MFALQDDEKLLDGDGSTEQLSLNRKHAMIVRVGEKRILHGTLRQLREKVAVPKNDKKRGREEDKSRRGGKGKKARK